MDVVEFDVRAINAELVLAHTIFQARRGGSLRLRAALDHLSARCFSGIDLNVDVKHGGCEGALLDSLRSAGMVKRTVISSQVPAVLDRIRSLEPRARLGISIGGRLARVGARWRDWREQVLAGLHARRWDAVMAQHRLVDPWLLEDVIDRKGLLYAWTVNERRAIDALRSLGVHGIATADPRLFSAWGAL